MPSRDSRSAKLPTPAAPDTTINPYHVLDLPVEATAIEVRTAYKKLALRLHPDKVGPEDRSEAHIAFQNLAFAYAILSNPSRRSLYDRTGSTSSTLADDPDFDWVEFFRTQYASVTPDAVKTFADTYKGSEEERQDVLEAYTKHEGKWKCVYEDVMLSSPLEDEERYRGWIDEVIKTGVVEGYKAYTDEKPKEKERRMQKARKEAKEAEAAAKEIGKKKAGREEENGSNNADAGLSGLAAMIQQRQKGRAEAFLNGLEARYANGTGSAKKGKRKLEEPDEEAFKRMAERGKGGKEKSSAENGKTRDGRKPKRAKVVEDEEEGEEEEKMPKSKRRKDVATRRGKKVSQTKDHEEEDDEDEDVDDGGGSETLDSEAEHDDEAEEEEEEVVPKSKKAKKAKKAAPAKKTGWARKKGKA